jgi:HdeA/HdeB family protein
MVMRRLLTAGVAALAWWGASLGAAQAQGLRIPCESFVKNDDGTWSALHSVQIPGTGGALTIRDGSVMRPGAVIRGVDVASILDQQCPAEPVAAPAAPSGVPAVPAGPAQTRAAPYVVLDTFVTAKGTIDTARLTCGEIADASPQEAAMFLTWYSGYFTAAAKKRGVNLAAVRHTTLAVIDYCKSNRDKKLVQVMELMLK